mmetsp:Transcript_71756/g.207810  ORF Transcript_71756/g.207810 Transcript_71756/m.207810 type:complete len:129 (-) Transcript_71756:93-479(-)
MGQVCECEGNKDIEVSAARPPPDDVVQAPGAVVALDRKASPPGSVPQEIRRLWGVWKTEGDQQTMGRIEGQEIVWDNAFNYSRSPLKINPRGRIEMELSNKVYSGTVIDGEPLRLKWSDGEVWIRIAR